MKDNQAYRNLEVLPDRPLNPDPMTRAGTADLVDTFYALRRQVPPTVRTPVSPPHPRSKSSPPHRISKNTQAVHTKAQDALTLHWLGGKPVGGRGRCRKTAVASAENVCLGGEEEARMKPKKPKC